MECVPRNWGTPSEVRVGGYVCRYACVDVVRTSNFILGLVFSFYGFVYTTHNGHGPLLGQQIMYRT